MCNPQGPLQLNAINTCPTTQIVSEPINTQFNLVQGNIDTSFRFSAWVWPDTIGYVDSASLGFDKCGTKSYTVVD